MVRRHNSVRPIGWLTFVGLACLASTALLRRALRREPESPENLYRHDSDEQMRCYS